MLFSLNIVYYVINIAKDPSLLQAISSLSYFVFIVFLIYIVVSALLAPIGQLYFSIVIIYFFIKLAFKYLNRNLRMDTDKDEIVSHPLMKFFIEPTNIEQPPVSSQKGGNPTSESEPPKSKLQYSKLFFLFMLPHFIGNDKNSYINTTPNIMKIPNILFIVLFIFFTWKMIELIVGYTNTDVKISGIKGSSFFIILFFITAVIWIFLIIHFAKLFKYLKELVEQNKYTIKANSNYEPFNLLGTNNMLNMASKAATGDDISRGFKYEDFHPENGNLDIGDVANIASNFNGNIGNIGDVASNFNGNIGDVANIASNLKTGDMSGIMDVDKNVGIDPSKLAKDMLKTVGTKGINNMKLPTDIQDSVSSNNISTNELANAARKIFK
jgi:hypothetical protein